MPIHFNTLQLLPCNYFRFPSCLFISFHSSWKISEIQKKHNFFLKPFLEKVLVFESIGIEMQSSNRIEATRMHKKSNQDLIPKSPHKEITAGGGRLDSTRLNQTDQDSLKKANDKEMKEAKARRSSQPARKHEGKNDTSWIVHPTWRSLTQSIEKLRRSIYILLFIGSGWTINQFPRLDCCGLHIQYYNVCIMQTKTTYIVDIDNIDKEWHRIIWYGIVHHDNDNLGFQQSIDRNKFGRLREKQKIRGHLWCSLPDHDTRPCVGLKSPNLPVSHARFVACAKDFSNGEAWNWQDRIWSLHHI